jgi:hypothetical protein
LSSRIITSTLVAVGELKMISRVMAAFALLLVPQEIAFASTRPR